MLLLLLLAMWLRAPPTFPPVTRWAFIGLLALGAIGLHPPAGGKAQGPPPRTTATDGLAEDSIERLTSVREEPRQRSSSSHREGTRLETVPGRVIEVGRRWAFVSDQEQTTFRLLENLALERIARAIRLEPGDDHWAVSGTLTEFSGQNYLLLQVVTRASSRPTGQAAPSSPTGRSEPAVPAASLARPKPLE